MLACFAEVANKFCPIREYHVTKDRPPFLTDERLETIKQRDTVMRQAKQTKNEETWKDGLALVKDVMTACKKSKQSYIIDKLHINRKNSRNFWDSVKLILPDKQSKSIDTVWDENKKEMVTGLQAANLIIDYFACIGEKLAGKEVSLLPLPGKVFEKILHKRMYNYLETNKLICNEQGEFRQNHETVQTVLDLTDYI